jgi:hypothetical protein
MVLEGRGNAVIDYGVAICLWWEVYQRACKRKVREGIGVAFKGRKVWGKGVRAGEDLA